MEHEEHEFGKIWETLPVAGRRFVKIRALLGICFWGRPLSEPSDRTGGRGKGGWFLVSR